MGTLWCTVHTVIFSVLIRKIFLHAITEKDYRDKNTLPRHLILGVTVRSLDGQHKPGLCRKVSPITARQITFTAPFSRIHLKTKREIIQYTSIL